MDKENPNHPRVMTVTLTTDEWTLVRTVLIERRDSMAGNLNEYGGLTNIIRREFFAK